MDFFMQKKDHTFAKFCEFKALVEKDTSRKVKALIRIIVENMY